MRIFQVLLILFTVTACFQLPKPAEKPVLEESYSIGFVVPRASENITAADISRTATDEEWIAAVKPAFEAQFEPFDGGNVFHLAIIIDGYILATPGVPIILSPKSALVYRVMVIDDSTGETLNPAPKQITTIENITGSTIIGSGFTMTREEQIDHMAKAAAKHAQRWLSEQDWFVEAALKPVPIAEEVEEESDETQP